MAPPDVLQWTVAGLETLRAELLPTSHCLGAPARLQGARALRPQQECSQASPEAEWEAEGLAGWSPVGRGTSVPAVDAPHLLAAPTLTALRD